MRGSDPDAAVYWLARMLEAGEDARFIARRMVIFASEDVGMADPQALLVAVAAAHAVEHVGLPEAQLNLSQAAVHLATAPKSNRAALAIWDARAAVRDGAVGARCPRTCATPTTRAPHRSDTASGTSTLMITTVAGSTSSTCPTGSATAGGTSRPATVSRRRSTNG
jgi:replication-associated recombination protein RarA